MAANARFGLDPVSDLRRRLARRPRRSTPRTWVMRWWNEHGLDSHPAAVGKRIALALLEQPGAEEQLAAIVILHELLADHLRATDLPAFARALDAGALDGASVDVFAIKVLGTMLHRVRGRAELARAIAQWRTAESPWRRRAACVAFTQLAPQGDAALAGLAQLIFAVCSTIVWSPERLDQTAVGWLLGELGRGEPTRVETFVRRHARFMSRECLRLAIEKLPASRATELVAHWKRATTARAR